ncbi:MAG: sigma-70 family RNA polymerase sigma factor, partial [Planctomycetales bacterium]|nr:sigma-70 family RNA polymerase sigma factor [Planctomycetales bacterium]
MPNSPLTRSSLLIRVRNSSDANAWTEFVEIYAPLVHAYGMKKGLQDADAADLAQDVLTSVAKAMPSFDYARDRGSFRGWLFTITLNRLRRMATQKQRQVVGSGESNVHEVLLQHPDAPADEDAWNREHKNKLFQ